MRKFLCILLLTIAVPLMGQAQTPPKATPPAKLKAIVGGSVVRWTAPRQ